MKVVRHTIGLAGVVLACASLQGCFVAAAGAAGAAGGYEAKRHGYEVQSPVKKDTAGGYKGQNPVVHDPAKDQTAPDNQTPTSESSQ